MAEQEGVYYVPQSNRPDIQEGIAKWLHGASTNPWKEPDWKDIPEWRRDQYRKNAYFLMVKLDGEGVVLRVKCPYCKWSQFVGEESVGMTPCHSCGSTGYLIESLIKEKK